MFCGLSGKVQVDSICHHFYTKKDVILIFLKVKLGFHQSFKLFLDLSNQLNYLMQVNFKYGLSKESDRNVL
jgi:hypothetical protein